MKILSLFDGISCARVALERAGIPVELYYASEVDKYAIQTAQQNYPDAIQLGDIKEIDCTGGKLHYGYGRLAETDIDLIVGGSPCQDLSIAKKNRKGLDGERSGLFWEYVRILKEVKPKYFILENVASMPKEAKQMITDTLWGIEPVIINASLVSAQNRKRLFWVGKLTDKGHIVLVENWEYEKVNIPQPQDRGILLKDILEEGVIDREKSYAIDANYFKGGKIGGTHQSSKRNYTIRLGQIGKGGQGDRIYDMSGKSVALSAHGGGRGAKTGLYKIQKEPHGTALDYYNDTIVPNGKSKILGTNPQSTTAIAGQLVNDNSIIRKLTPIECERLQGLPDNYTQVGAEIFSEGVLTQGKHNLISNSQRYKMLGNAFNVDVVAHILSFII